MYYVGPDVRDEPIEFAVLSQNGDLFKKDAKKGHNLSLIVDFTKESSSFAGISLYNEVTSFQQHVTYDRAGIFFFQSFNMDICIILFPSLCLWHV